MPAVYDGLGTELIVDEVFAYIRETLNDTIADINVTWGEYDVARAARFGVDTPVVEVEPIDLTPRPGFPYGNFHVGSIPSFVQTEDREMYYPMVVVMPVRTVPDAEDARMDQMNVYSNGIQVHSFARAAPAEGEEVAYRRAMRMAEAVHRVIHDPRSSLRAIVAGVQGPTLVDRSEPWLFPAEDGHGDDWVWRAVMHQYQIRNYSSTAPQEV